MLPWGVLMSPSLAWEIFDFLIILNTEFLLDDAVRIGDIIVFQLGGFGFKSSINRHIGDAVGGGDIGSRQNYHDFIAVGFLGRQVKAEFGAGFIGGNRQMADLPDDLISLAIIIYRADRGEIFLPPGDVGRQAHVDLQVV